MPKTCLTKDQKRTYAIKRDVKKYMEYVRDFVAKQNNGKVPFELEASLQMLETYYEEFQLLTYEISKLDSLLSDSRYGKIPHPLLAARDKVTVKLQSLLQCLGCTLKEQVKMKVTEPVVEESPLETLIKGKIEKRG